MCDFHRAPRGDSFVRRKKNINVQYDYIYLHFMPSVVTTSIGENVSRTSRSYVHKSKSPRTRTSASTTALLLKTQPPPPPPRAHTHKYSYTEYETTSHFTRTIELARGNGLLAWCSQTMATAGALKTFADREACFTRKRSRIASVNGSPLRALVRSFRTVSVRVGICTCV